MFLINLFLLPFKIVNFIIVDIFCKLFIIPILSSSAKNGPKELFVWFCIIASLMYIFGALSSQW